MELIRILQEHCGKRRSVRKALRMYGADNDDMFTQPLATMLPNRAIRLVTNWLMINAETGDKVDLRILEPSEQKVYMSDLAVQKTGVYVQRMREVPMSTNEILHIWEPSVNYQTLTLEEIQLSIERAEAAKLLNDCGALEKLSITNK